MATYAGKLRSTGIDNGSIKLNEYGQLTTGVAMEPFTGKKGAPSVFYVDGNVVASGDGTKWDRAFKTIAEGLVAAQAYTATSANRAWAQTATLYCCADWFIEDLVILAQKADIIGVGRNTSMPCTLTGNHIPVTTNTYGCHFHNMHFNESDNGAIWTLTAPSNGIQFHGCAFSSRGAVATHGILATAVGGMVVDHCDFWADINSFTTGCIVLGAGDAAMTRITNNYFNGSIGITINASTTCNAGQIIIDSNVFRCKTFALNDDSDLSLFTRNRVISDVNNHTSMTSIIDVGAGAVGNIVTGSADTDTYPFATVS